MSVTTADEVYPATVSSNETLDFTITSSPSACVVSVLYPSGQWDVVYIDSAFASAYSTSTLDGNTFHIRRNAGWPKGVRYQIKVTEQPLTPSLIDTVDSPLAQYTLNSLNSPNGQHYDRSGNARHLSTTNVYDSPDLIPGNRARTTGCAPVGSYAISDTSSPYSAFRVTGALTITCRAWLSNNYINDGTNRYLGCQAKFSDGTSAGNALYLFGKNGSGKLLYVRDTGTHSGTSTTTSTLTLSDSGWHFFGLRRASSGNVTFTLDGVNEGPFTVSSPTGGSTSFLSIGANPNNLEPWIGAIADYCIWGSSISDAQMLAHYKKAMGVA